MVLTATGEDPNTTLTQYADHTEIVHRRGKLLVFDAGAGKIVAEFTGPAADAVRNGIPARLIFDGQSITLEEPPS